ncbi:MAG TPA: nucleotidyltransferase domain-containing protein [Spirochaetia bacterium]|nr:nucleotidyltransferase domain-containing protein [Spirochaetia bacterium]
MQRNVLSQTGIDELVRQIVDSFNPKKIMLFGSYARGDFHSGSDLDLCIIADSELDWFERNLAFKRKIHSEIPHIEAHIYTQAEWDKMLQEERPLALQILKEGKILYEQE